MRSPIADLLILCQKSLSRLPMPVQQLVAALFTRARDPEPEVLYRKTQRATEEQATMLGWLPMLTFVGALGLLSVVHACAFARAGAAGAEIFFWSGLFLLFAPSVARLLSSRPSRLERLLLICMVGMALYFATLMFNPTGFFSPYDEFLHWRTADDILTSRHLFTPNTMLPVSSFYPALEIVTNTLSTMSGLNTFYAGMIVIGVARLVMVLALFLFYERVTKSARMAGIASILYMTNPHFLFFDAQFAYESLALPLATFVLFALARHEKPTTSQSKWLHYTAWMVWAAVAFTHHVTSFIFCGLFILWTLIYAVQRPVATLLRSQLTKTTLFALSITLVSTLRPGNPVIIYLSEYFITAFNELGHLLLRTGSARPLFAVYAGYAPQLWERLVSISSVALIGLFLPFGLFCLWIRYRTNVLIVMLGTFSLAYPVSQVFRFTTFGIEITDRSAAFIFLAVAYVLTLFIVQYWPVYHLSWRQILLLTLAISLLFFGGIMIGNGTTSQFLPGPYEVGSDNRSVGPEGIQTALWARAYLGPNNRMATDRNDRVLMSTYGYQHIVSNLDNSIDVTPVFFATKVGPNQIALLQRAQVQYLVVDQRLATSLPSLGFYFDVGEAGAFQRTTPIQLASLTKFNSVPGINRVFDSGNIVLYDVGGLLNAQKKS